MFPLIARWVPGLGFVFAILVVIASFLTNDSPDSNASDETIRAYYLDGGNRDGEIVAFFLIGLAALCFLQFLGSLRGALARAEGEPSRITTAAIASGAAFISLAVAAHAVGAATSWAVEIYDERFTVDPNTVRLALAVSYGFFVMSLFAAAAMALATATIALWMRPFPAWLAWLSVLATIAGLLGVLGLTALVVLVWIALLSLYLVWPKPTAAAPPS